MTLPIARTFPPSFVARPAPSLASMDTPFGYAYAQALDADVVARTVREMATAAGIDARAAVAFDPVLRWHVSERYKETREPVILSHAALTGGAGDRFEGVLFVVALQIKLPNEAHQAYRELFTDQPIRAAIGSLVATCRDVPLIDIETLPEAQKQRRAALIAQNGRMGEALFGHGRRYDTTLDMSLTSAQTLRDDAEDSDDMPIDAIVQRARGRPAERPAPARPDASQLQLWRHSCLASRRYGVDIILRGYVSMAAVRAARRYAHNDDVFYVLPPTAIRTAVDLLVDEAPPSTEPPIEIARQPHLLDRLYRLDLARLTHYEIDRSVRHRVNHHATIYAFLRSSESSLDDVGVRCYPRGYEAPVRQSWPGAPGLLSTATPHDYAAVALMSLCIIAYIEPSLRQWILDAEVMYFQFTHADRDAQAFHDRIVEQMAAIDELPDPGLLALYRDVIADMRVVIAGIDAQLVESAPVDEPIDYADDDGPVEELVGEGDKIE